MAHPVRRCSHPRLRSGAPASSCVSARSLRSALWSAPLRFASRRAALRFIAGRESPRFARLTFAPFFSFSPEEQGYAPLVLWLRMILMLQGRAGIKLPLPLAHAKPSTLERSKHGNRFHPQGSYSEPHVAGVPLHGDHVRDSLRPLLQWSLRQMEGASRPRCRRTVEHACRVRILWRCCVSVVVPLAVVCSLHLVHAEHSLERVWVVGVS